jgi:hypothetical protein
MIAAGQPVPADVVVAAMLDTGASGTVLDAGIIRQLGLIVTGVTPMLTPSTGAKPHDCKQYDTSLWIIMDTDTTHRVSLMHPVFESDLSVHGFQALIGRDVLSRGSLCYNGKQKSISLAF